MLHYVLKLVYLTGLTGEEYTIYEDMRKIVQWMFTLKPKDVRKYGISKQTLSNTN